MKDVLLFSSDLLFASKLLAIIESGGYEAQLCMDSNQLLDKSYKLLIFDLTRDVQKNLPLIKKVKKLNLCLKLLGFYSHVDIEIKTLAESSGFDLVVPRSRMLRESSVLIAKFL